VVVCAIMFALILWVPGSEWIIGSVLIALLAYGGWLRVKERRSKAPSE
jgi:hypothetical protein